MSFVFLTITCRKPNELDLIIGNLNSIMLIVDSCKFNSFYNRNKKYFNATYAWFIIQIVANSEYLVSFSWLLIRQRLHLVSFSWQPILSCANRSFSFRTKNMPSVSSHDLLRRTIKRLWSCQYTDQCTVKMSCKFILVIC